MYVSIKDRILVLMVTGMLLFGLSLGVVTVAAVDSPVVYHSTDTTTGGNWVGTYGSCGHILPGAPVWGDEVVVGEYSVPIGPLTNDPYFWTPSQVRGLTHYKPDPQYWDEYVPGTSGILYEISGTRVGTIQYPAFEWKWSEWTNTQSKPGGRDVYYTMSLPGTDDEPSIDKVPGSNGPGWRLAAWDDGGERGRPEHGYMNFTLTFPRIGTYLLSLYAYDKETNNRESQEYRIYDATGTQLLASKQIAGAAFDNGVYETFEVTVPLGGLTIIVQVYNDAGYAPYVNGVGVAAGKTINVVLSGIFVDCDIEYRGATPGFWKNNIGKQTVPKLVKGEGIQIPVEQILSALEALQLEYSSKLPWFPTGSGNTLLVNAYNILAGAGAKGHTLSLLLTAGVLGTGTNEITIPGYGTHTVAEWIALITTSPPPSDAYILAVAGFLNNYNHY